MRILVACEFSGITREAFAALGHDVLSCDILPTEIPGNHYQGDVRDVLYEPWDMICAHPPCQYLANSGVRWLHTQEGRWDKMHEGAAFFRMFMDHPCKRKMIENSVMHKHALAAIGGVKQTQSIQPYQFGIMQTKRICLWLTGLPPLIPTKSVKEAMLKLPYGQRALVHYEGPSPERAKNRARWYPLIAEAQADQWGRE
jgi:hypothetical protein